MKLSPAVAITMLAALAAVEAKNPAKARAAQEARARSAVKKAAARGLDTPKHIVTLLRNLGIDERKFCDEACQQAKADKKAAKEAAQAAKAAAKAAKAAAKQAAKEAKAAAKEAAKQAKAEAKAAAQAAKEAAKEAAQAAKDAAKEAALAAKEAKKAEKAAAKEAAQAAEQAAKDAAKAEKAAKKEAEQAAKQEAQANKSLKTFKIDRANDYCVSANDFVLWEPFGDSDSYDWDSDGTMVESQDGYLTVSRPSSANTHSGWYLLVGANSGSDMKEIYLDDDDYISMPGRFHRVSGFDDWCEIEEAGSGSGAGSGAGSDELVSVSSRQFQGEVTLTVGSSDPNEFNWWYCFPTNKGDENC